MPLRRANSVPVHPPEVSALDTNALQQLESEVHVPSAPSNADPRSPTADHTTTTFSPVFDLELGSAASTPQAPQRDRQRSAHRGPHRVPFSVHHDPGAVPFANGPGHPPPLPSLRQQQLAPAVLPTAAAAAVRQQPLVQRSPATVAACAAAAMDRSQSDLQVMLQHSGVKAVAGAGAAALTPAAQRIMDLCRPANELELELSRRLRAFRAARIAKPVSAFKASSGALAASASAATSTATATPSTFSSTSNGVHTQPHKQPQPHPSLLSASSSPPGPTPGEIEALATELLGAGFVVQLLDGTRLSRDTRSCLRTLKHRFLVCVGWDRPAHAPGAAAGTAAGAGAASGLASSGISGDGACGSGSGSDGHGHGQGGQGLGQGDPQPHEPLVVEVRFREQFLIAHPTRGYEQLLLAMPVVFVGTLRRLDAVVEVMAAEVAAAFRQAGRPLPPWRTKGAMLSKWAPEQLCDLSRLMQQAALMQHMAAAQQAAAAAEHGAGAGAGAGALVTGPLAPGDLDASWGSGITVEQPAAAALWGGAVGVGPVGVLPAHYANLPGAPSAVAAAAAEAAAAGPGAGAVALAGGGTAAAQQATSYVPMMPSAFANCVSGTPAAARGGGGGGGMGPIAAVAAAAAAGAGGGGGPHSARLRAPSHGPPTTTGFFYVRDEPNSGELDLMGCGDLAPAKSVSAPSSSHTARVHLLPMAAAGAAASYGGAGSVGGAGSFSGSGAMAGSVAHVLSVGAAALQGFGAGGDGGAAGLMAAPPVAAPAAVGAALGQAGLAAQVDRLLPLVAGSGSPASAASALAASAMPAARPLAAPELTLRAAGGGKAAEAEASDAAWGHGARGQSAFAALARAQAPASPEQALGMGMGVHGMDAVHVLNTHDLARIAQTSGYYGSGGGGLPGPVAVYRGSGAVASGPAAAPAAAAGAAWHPLAPPPHLSAPHATVTAAAGATGGLLEPSPSFEPVELTVGWPDEEDDDEGDDRFDDDDGSLGAAELPPTLVGSSGDAAFGGGGFGSAVGSSGGLTFPILPGAGLGLQHPVQQLDAPVSADGILLASELPAALRPPSGGAVSPFARASMPEGICGGTGGGGRDGSAGQAAEYWDSGDATPEARTSGNAAAAAAAAVTTGPAASGTSAAAASVSSSQHGRSHLGHSQHAHHGHGQHVPGNGSGDSLPEFTLRHSALGHLHHYNASEEADSQLDASRRHNNPRNHNLHNGQGAAAGRAATLPVPTPPRAAGLASAATVPAADSGSADRDVVGALVRLHRPTSALARAQQLQLQQEQEQLQQQGRQPLMPLAAGAAAGHSAFAAAPQQQPQQQPQQPHYQAVAEQQQQQQHHGEGGGGSGSVFMLHQMASDVLRITRRSSSDLSRAALKFKNAKSLLAAALRRPRTGSKDGTPASIGLGNGGAGVALPVASPLAGNGVSVGAGSLEGGAGQVTGAGMQQAQPQQPRDGGMVRDSTRLRVAGAGAGAGAAAAGAGSGAAGKEQAGATVSGTAVQHHQHHQHHHGATQVTLAGGVMTKPSADEPAWARISTVRWGPAPAQAPAAAAAVVVAPASAGSARPVAAGAPQPIAGR